MKYVYNLIVSMTVLAATYNAVFNLGASGWWFLLAIFIIGGLLDNGCECE